MEALQQNKLGPEALSSRFGQFAQKPTYKTMYRANVAKKAVIALIAFMAFSPMVSGQVGLSNVASFTNRLVPHLLQALSYDQENIVYSPFGLSTSLAIVLEGVDDHTALEMCKILGLGSPKATRESFRLGFKASLEILEHKKNNDDSITGSFNKATIHSSMPLIPQFSSLLRTFYKVNIQNNITGNATDLVFDLRSDIKVMSHWKNYDKLAVYTYLNHQPSVPFMTSSGDVVSVPMVPQIGRFKAGYHPKLSSQVVQLPLEDENLNVVLIMPDSKDGIPDLLIKMLKTDSTAFVKDIPWTEAEVSLPQFVIVSSDLDTGKVLQKSGLEIAFVKGSRQGNKYRIRNDNAEGLIKSIKQNAYFATSFIAINTVASSDSVLCKPQPKEEIDIEIDKEVGNVDRNETEAFLDKNAERRKRDVSQHFVFNRPFIFQVHHSKSGIILLAGVVKSPKQVP